jgi:hypothetical protein
MLGVADYVHLSLHSMTPLLADKLKKGYAHALIEFDRQAVLALPETAILPYNTKAWNSKSAFVPITDEAGKRRLLDERAAGGRNPSLEVLVKYGLSLEHAERVIYSSTAECDAVRRALISGACRACLRHEVEISAFPMPNTYEPVRLPEIESYFARCRSAGTILPPPTLPFD